MKPLLLFLLLSGCAKPNFSAVSRPQVGAPNAILSILPPTNVFQVRTVTWITVDPALERITKIARVPVLYSNGVRIGPKK